MNVDISCKPFWASPRDPIPQGFRGFFNQDGGLSGNDQFALTSMKNDLLSGDDTSGMDMSDEVNADNAMTMINQYDPNDQFVKIPGKEIPGLGNDIRTQYIKIPKQAAKIASLPGSKIIYYDEASGKALTVDAVKQIAKDKGYSIEEFLKVSGIGK